MRMMFTTGCYWWKIRTSQLQNCACASGTYSMGCHTQPLGRYVRHAEIIDDSLTAPSDATLPNVARQCRSATSRITTCLEAHEDDFCLQKCLVSGTIMHK